MDKKAPQISRIVKKNFQNDDVLIAIDSFIIETLGDDGIEKTIIHKGEKFIVAARDKKGMFIQSQDRDLTLLVLIDEVSPFFKKDFSKPKDEEPTRAEKAAFAMNSMHKIADLAESIKDYLGDDVKRSFQGGTVGDKWDISLIYDPAAIASPEYWGKLKDNLMKDGDDTEPCMTIVLQVRRCDLDKELSDE